MSRISDARDLVHTALGIVSGEIVGSEAEVSACLDSALSLIDQELDPRRHDREVKEAIALGNSHSDGTLPTD